MARRLVVNNLVVVSDLHCICQFGLCPPERFRLDGGGHYSPSRLQRQIWKRWRQFWDEWVPMACRGEPFAVAVNGDIVDGPGHHGSSTQLSSNRADEKRLALTCLRPIAKLCEGRLYIIRGTEAHTGPSAHVEEEIATELKAIPDEDGCRARYVLWKYVGPKQTSKCALVNILHHIGTTSSSHYESTAVHKELTEAFQEAGRWKKRPPDVVVRSHRHRNIGTNIAVENARAFGVVTPGWQGKTPFTYRVAGGRQAEPQFGGILIRWEPEEFYVRQRVWPGRRPRAE